MAHTDRPGLIVVCGATATGKTSLAIELAQRLGSIVISADSRLVYREFDIGTAKPNYDERVGVPHEAIDICDPRETLTVAAYQEQVRGIIAREHDRIVANPTALASWQIEEIPELARYQGWPILAGGTGLYIKAIVRGMRIPRVAPDYGLRAQLEALGQPHCYALLKHVDPETKIHANDAHRTQRALEVFYVTGRSLTSQQGEDPPDYPVVQIGLGCDRERMAQRIVQRTNSMVEASFIGEVEELVAKYGAELPLLETLGYAEFRQYLAGNISLGEAIELTAVHTRQFAKRQRTWFQKDETIAWIDADAPDRLELALGVLRDRLRDL
ncbi:MAG: tRNA (adenosine(37)-N6)-dimethylallyltransferase MiaA [Geitlerinemataceae cyanobacterium]